MGRFTNMSAVLFIYSLTLFVIGLVSEQISALHYKGPPGRILEEVLFDDPSQPTRFGVADTSDPSWSPEMQTAWPHFIMGASRLWLGLIQQLDTHDQWPNEPLARYASLDDALTALWRSEPPASPPERRVRLSGTHGKPTGAYAVLNGPDGL